MSESGFEFQKRLIEEIADELRAHGEFGPSAGANHTNSLVAAEGVLDIVNGAIIARGMDDDLTVTDWEAEWEDWFSQIGPRVRKLWNTLPYEVRKAISDDAREAEDSDVREAFAPYQETR